VRQLAQGRDPLTYGDVIGPAEALVPGSHLEALNVCEPTYFDHKLAVLDVSPSAGPRHVAGPHSPS